MRITVKNLPRLQLADLLKRRKMTLDQFITEHAITTYDGLCARCERMGVSPPDEQSYRTGTLPRPAVNSPQEGVVVVGHVDSVDKESPDVKVDSTAPLTTPPTQPVQPTPFTTTEHVAASSEKFPPVRTVEQRLASTATDKEASRRVGVVPPKK